MAPKKPHFLVFTPHAIPTSHIYQGGSVQPRVEWMVWNFQDQVVGDTTCFLFIHLIALQSVSPVSPAGEDSCHPTAALWGILWEGSEWGLCPKAREEPRTPASRSLKSNPPTLRYLPMTAATLTTCLQPVTEAGEVAPTCSTKTVWDTECYYLAATEFGVVVQWYIINIGLI